jgi:membrane associated rhomboid family serine protease
VGRRSQRPLRSSIGAVLRDAPPYVTIAMVAVNVAIYLITAVQSHAGLTDPSARTPPSSLFFKWELVPYFVYHQHEYYRLITAAFLHANLLHIATNMVSLCFVGPYLERSLGWWRYLSLYLLSALGGSAAVYAFGSPDVAVVGASTAIFGLLGACLVLVRRLNLDLQWVLMIIVLNFVFTFSIAGISRLGHIGGFVAGGLVGLAIGGLPSTRRRLPDRVQVAGLAGVLALLVLVIGLATAVGDF